MATRTDTDRREARRRMEHTERGSGRGRRIAGGILGGILLVRGLGRRSLRGIAMVLAGGWLMSRALGEDTRRKLRSRTPFRRGGGERSGSAGVASISRSITVGRPADELYEIWRDPGQLSEIMGHFATVTAAGENRLRWTARGPRGRDVSWETRIVEDESGEYLRWETPEDATVPNEGTVRFQPAPSDRGTEVTLSIDFTPPGGSLATAALRRLDVVPNAIVGTALHRFKALAETGEIPTLEGNPSDRGRGDLV